MKFVTGGNGGAHAHVSLGWITPAEKKRLRLASQTWLALNDHRWPDCLKVTKLKKTKCTRLNNSDGVEVQRRSTTFRANSVLHRSAIVFNRLAPEVRLAETHDKFRNMFFRSSQR